MPSKEKNKKKMSDSKFGSILEKIKSGARGFVKNVSRPAGKEYKQAQARKEIKSIERGWGTVDNYVKNYPDYSARAKRLKKEAGY